MRKRRGCTKALISVVVTLAMALSLTPLASALAEEPLSPGTPGDLGSLQSWEPPTQITATSVVKDGKTYSYVTSATRKVTESAADMLGICNVTVCPTAGNPFTYDGTAEENYASIKTSARFGIYGSDVNQNMNPYYANYFYNAYQLSLGEAGADLADARDTVLVDQRLNPGAPNSALLNVATEFGTSPILYYRPDMLYGVTSLTAKDSEETLAYGAATTSVSGYSELVEKIRNKELGEYEGLSLYQEGDENYDPYYVMYDMNDFMASTITNLYSLANAAEGVIERAATTDKPKTTRYEDPLEIASNFERYVRGTQYAVLSAIANGKTARKTIGVVKTADATENTITFVPCNPQGKDTNDSVEFLEAVTDNICGKNNLGDNANVGTAKDLMDCDAVYILGYGGIGTSDGQYALKDTLTTVLQNAGYDNESEYPEMNVQTPKTVIHRDKGGSVEGCVLVGSLIGFAYPEIINPVHSLAYFYESFYHVKDSRLQDALGLNLAGMSLPTGVELSLAGYSKSAYQNILEEGIVYYLNNKEAIDTAYPKLIATDEMTKYHGLFAVGYEGTYDGASHAITISPNLPENTVVEYSVNGGAWTTAIPAITNVGTMNVQVRATNPSYETAMAEATLTVKPASIAKAKVAAVSKTFTGNSITAKPTVTLNGKKLASGTDYALSGNAKTNAGTYNITVTGKGNYTGTAKGKFTIAPAAQKLKVATAAKSVNLKKVAKAKQTTSAVKVSGAKGKVTYFKKGGNAKLSIGKTSGKITVKKGTAKGVYSIKIMVKAAKAKNYKATSSKIVTIKVKVK